MSKQFKIGQKVKANGYEGTIVRHYSGDLWEVRLASGVICTDAFYIIEL